VEELFREVAGSIALCAEAAAVLIIGYGTVEAFVLILKRFGSRWKPGTRKEAWLRLGMWLLLGLEFKLAPISFGVSSHRPGSISGNWAIAVIRTFLNYFLEKDLEKYAKPAAA